jgi:hypothetical protein
LTDLREVVSAAAEYTGAQHAIKTTIVTRVGLRFIVLKPSMATFKASMAESGRPASPSFYQNTRSPSAISASGDSRMISERAFFAPKISTSD